MIKTRLSGADGHGQHKVEPAGMNDPGPAKQKAFEKKSKNQPPRLAPFWSTAYEKWH